MKVFVGAVGGVEVVSKGFDCEVGVLAELVVAQQRRVGQLRDLGDLGLLLVSDSKQVGEVERVRVAGKTSEDDDLRLADLGRSSWLACHEVLVALVHDHLLPLGCLDLRSFKVSEVDKLNAVRGARLRVGWQTVENEHKLVGYRAHRSVASGSLQVVERRPGVSGNLIQLSSIGALVPTDMRLTSSCEDEFISQ